MFCARRGNRRINNDPLINSAANTGTIPPANGNQSVALLQQQAGAGVPLLPFSTRHSGNIHGGATFRTSYGVEQRREPMTSSWLMRGLKIAGALAIAAALSGCIVEPYGYRPPAYGYDHPRPYGY
jgi:hypothetical protein